MTPRSVAACALAVGLGILSPSTVMAAELDRSQQKPLGLFLMEQARSYQLARNPDLASRTPSLSRPAIELPNAATLLKKAAGTRVNPPTVPTNRQIVERLVTMSYRMMLARPESCCPCIDSSTCNDGLFCDGAETCVSGNCVAGAAPCFDGNPCTTDSCTESTDTCSFPPVPPPPVPARLDLGRSAPFSTVATLSWTPVSGASSYNIYRASFANLGGLACFDTGITGTSRNDNGAVPANAYFFLVTSLACYESGLGDGSPAPRPPAPGCP